MPVVVDANSVIGDCLRAGLPGMPTPLLLSVARNHLTPIRLYATSVVRAEIEQRLPGAIKSKHRREAVLAMWRDGFAATIHFVDAPLSGWASRDPRSLLVLDEDPDDYPTACLAEILGPCLVVSNDHSLVGAGIAQSKWANLMREAGRVGEELAGQSGAMFAASMTTELVRAGAEQARRHPRGAVALLVFIGIALWVANKRGRTVSSAVDTARELGREGSRRLSEVMIRAAEAREVIERAAFYPSFDPTERDRAIRLLARQSGPVRPQVLADELGLSHQKITYLLDSPGVIRLPAGSYRLGAPSLPLPAA